MTELPQTIAHLLNNESLKIELSSFLQAYGVSGLRNALNLYRSQQFDYICRTKTSISKINIYDIFYLEIHGHQITVHTSDHEYRKYGTLNQELAALSPFGFVKCSQNCVVSLQRLKAIHHDYIILSNNAKLHMSRHFAPKVIAAFYAVHP